MGAHLDRESLEMLGLAHGSSVVPSAEVPSRFPAADGARAIAGDAYEGASKLSSELAMWSPSMRSADGDILPNKGRIDARTLDTIRNDAYVAGGANLHRDNIVGALFLLNAKPATRTIFGKIDEKWEEEFQEEVEEKFTLDAESPKNWLDASRINTLTSMVRMVVGMFVPAGEVFGAVEWMRDEAFIRPCSTAIQIIDQARISTDPKYMADPMVRGGVRRNRFGAPQGYYVRMAHPSDWMTQDAYRWKYVEAALPWGRPQMIHIYEQERADQSRGITGMVAFLKEAKMTKKFRDTVLQNAVVNASFAASIESDLPSADVFAALGAQTDTAKALELYAAGLLDNIAAYQGGSKSLQIDGVKIPHLYPGTKLQIRPASNNGPLGTDFEQSLLRYIAANLGVSYEQLSRDYTKTNYSSARAAMNETHKFMQARKKFVADRFASIVYRLWLEEMLNKGEIDSMPAKMRQRGNMDWLYAPRMIEAMCRCDWIGVGRGQIDELKETQAAVLRLKYNLSTWEDEIGRFGKDWRQSFRQKRRESLMQTDLEIEPQEDNSINAASGSPREEEDA